MRASQRMTSFWPLQPRGVEDAAMRPRGGRGAAACRSSEVVAMLRP